MTGPALGHRAARALARQLDYQRGKASGFAGREAVLRGIMQRHGAEVQARIAAVCPLDPAWRVLEVGSGAHGLIFDFPAEKRIGVDPLADHYRALFPGWQHQAETRVASGEALPFAAASFDLVLCDNVVDHAQAPAAIMAEIARVMVPGGLLYFSVNVHHPLYRVASAVHGAWQALRLPGEVTPFADHTHHFTPAQARRLVRDAGLTVLDERDSVAAVKAGAARMPARDWVGWLKRRFFKNALYEVIARSA